MYSIGLFSKIHRISAKTLRHYDAIGLLKPAAISRETGYRYYTSAQIPTLNRVLAFKQMGLSLTDIQMVIDNPTDADLLLKLQEKKLLTELANTEQAICTIKNYRKHLVGDQKMIYAPIVKSLPSCTVASMRFKAESYDTFFDRIPKMGEEMRRLGAKVAHPNYCFNIYHDGEYRDADIDVETCEAVIEAKASSELVIFRDIPAIEQALCVFHKGPYHTIREAYAFAYQWIADNAFDVSDMPRESYIDGIWNKSAQEDWLTEIQIPIAKSVE